jgi:hypothetical protein
MNNSGAMVNLQIPTRMWIELHAGDPDARDVIVKMDDGTIYTALFVTIPYLHRQMDLTFDLSSQIPDTVPARFCALDIPHIAVESSKIHRRHHRQPAGDGGLRVCSPDHRPAGKHEDAARSNGQRHPGDRSVCSVEVLVVEEE